MTGSDNGEGSSEPLMNAKGMYGEMDSECGISLDNSEQKSTNSEMDSKNRCDSHAVEARPTPGLLNRLSNAAVEINGSDVIMQNVD